MIDFLNENRGFLQLLGIVFAAGMLWQRMRALEKAVMNGITARQNTQENDIDELKIARAKIETHCASREKWIQGIERDVKRLERQG
ncbi:unnamed protein product [marine sediment metagenome]|uniref:Uncharacterized protein n=1 Tax=marine sediment metagenome TaxID=412755 RepID=X0WW34_9ZZZZ